MKNNIYELLKKFNEIKKMGYIKSNRTGSTGIGKVFEELIGKEDDALSEPDFKGIEIKTKKAYSNSYTTLFNCTPKGTIDYEVKRLRETYGHPDKVLKDEKVLMNSIYGNKGTLVSNKYIFKLKVNHQEERIYLEIRDISFSLIENNVYWTFNDLKEKLEKKLSYLAFIKGYDTTRNNETYYKYTDIKFYKLKDFTNFINLIENGKIRVTFKIGVYRDGPKIRQTYDRGTSFQISEKDLLELFDYVSL